MLRGLAKVLEKEKLFSGSVQTHFHSFGPLARGAPWAYPVGRTLLVFNIYLTPYWSENVPTDWCVYAVDQWIAHDKGWVQGRDRVVPYLRRTRFSG